MKVTFPTDRKGVIEHMRGTFTVDVDVSTSDLIAELERRRPKRCICKCSIASGRGCGTCIWGIFIGEENGSVKDNFKEITK